MIPATGRVCRHTLGAVLPNHRRKLGDAGSRVRSFIMPAMPGEARPAVGPEGSTVNRGMQILLDSRRIKEARSANGGRAVPPRSTSGKDKVRGEQGTRPASTILPPIGIGAPLHLFGEVAR